LRKDDEYLDWPGQPIQYLDEWLSNCSDRMNSCGLSPGVSRQTGDVMPDEQ